MPLDLRATPWDKSALGLHTAEFLLNETDGIDDPVKWTELLHTKVDGELPDVIYGRIDSKFPHALQAAQQANFQFVESSIDVTLRIGPAWKPPAFAPASLELMDATAEDISSIEDMASGVFEYGRFAEDKTFSTEQVAKRQKQMVNDFFNRNAKIHVIKNRDEVAGFMISDTDEETKTVNLILGGVNPKYRMLTYRFWASSISIFRDMGYKKISTRISAANLPVVNLYSLFGFTFTDTLWGLRWWRVPQDTKQ